MDIVLVIIWYFFWIHYVMIIADAQVGRSLDKLQALETEVKRRHGCRVLIIQVNTVGDSQNLFPLNFDVNSSYRWTLLVILKISNHLTVDDFYCVWHSGWLHRCLRSTSDCEQTERRTSGGESFWLHWQIRQQQKHKNTKTQKHKKIKASDREQAQRRTGGGESFWLH